MPILSFVVITGAMCVFEVRRGKMTIVPHYFLGCFVSSTTVEMFRVVAEQLCRVVRRVAEALLAMVYAFTDDHVV